MLPWGLAPGRDICQYDVALWTMCNYVHQRPVLGTGERPWGISRAFLRFITRMSRASPPVGLRKEVDAPLQGRAPFSLTYSPWAQLLLAASGALGVWAGHPQSLPQPL